MNDYFVTKDDTTHSAQSIIPSESDPGNNRLQMQYDQDKTPPELVKQATDGDMANLKPNTQISLNTPQLNERYLNDADDDEEVKFSADNQFTAQKE